MWSRRQRVQELWLPKAFVSSDGIWHLPITSLPVDNFNVRVLWCKPTGMNYNMHGWKFFCRYCATGWFWWISGLRPLAMWSSSSFTKIIEHYFPMRKISWDKIKRVPLLLMPWPLSSPAIVSRVVIRLNHVNSKFATLYYIVNTIGRKGIGINDIDRIRIILIANRVNVSVLFF